MLFYIPPSMALPAKAVLSSPNTWVNKANTAVPWQGPKDHPRMKNGIYEIGLRNHELLNYLTLVFLLQTKSHFHSIRSVIKHFPR